MGVERGAVKMEMMMTNFTGNIVMVLLKSSFFML